MNVKKVLILFFSVFLMILVTTGCGITKTKTTAETKEMNEKEIKIDDLTKEKQTHNLGLKIVKGEYSADGSIPDDQRLVVLTVEISNDNYLEEVGVGAGDFQLVSEGKTYQMYGGKNNFGDMIKAKGQLEGTAAYLIPANVSKGTIIYQPVNPKWPDMEKLEWSFAVK
ncbi:hypothetical protein [Carnobacterium maltaromaticum]|uniref:hypothetical protein n=1 Tax=Carnobacterium maltaromaticum TaxID=2751 RepID=UPI00295EC4F1|nr:hypothetical protein [Carnobacterium maltaromaticum]